MKTTSIILLFSLILSSCYSYRPFDPEEYAAANGIGKENAGTSSSKKMSRNDINGLRTSNRRALSEEEVLADRIKENDTKKDLPKIDPSTIKITDIIKENQFYQVESFGKDYKIEAKQWKADTLYAVVKGKPERELKFHKNDISDVKIRKFSKGKSDALTVTAYALGGVGVFLLLK